MTENRRSVKSFPNFQMGDLYVRREIHDEFGGQRQGGISTPASTPAIFIFTGVTGREHGYGYDGWQDPETFFYTGEGQPDHGDMQFARGNKAIRDHQENGKQVYLFENLPKSGETRGKVRFVTKLELMDYQVRERDSSGIPRSVIIFRFRRQS